MSFFVCGYCSLNQLPSPFLGASKSVSEKLYRVEIRTRATGLLGQKVPKKQQHIVDIFDLLIFNYDLGSLPSMSIDGMV